MNIKDKLPKWMYAEVGAKLSELYAAPTRADANGNANVSAHCFTT